MGAQPAYLTGQGLGRHQFHWRAMRADACRQHDVRGLGLRTSLRSAPRALKAKYGWSPEFDGIAHQLRNPGIMPHLRKTGDEVARAVLVVARDRTPEAIDGAADPVEASPAVEELSHRQLINPDCTVDRTCGDCLRAGHKDRWWRIEQADCDHRVLNDRIVDGYEDLRAA